MALAQYSDRFWFPSGVLATSVPARVFLLGSNTLATLYTDVTGTTTLSNPLNTDASGQLAFWAEEGEYWIHLDTESFRVSVGSPNLDVFEAATAAISTGVISGGQITVNAGNPLAIDISPMVGYVVDTATDPVRPTAVRVSTPALTVPLDAAALLRTITWWLADSTGVVIQQAATPTPEQRRTHILLGATAQDGASIYIDLSLPVILQQPANQLADLMDSLGTFRVSGVNVTPNGANLMLNLSAGTMFARSFGHFSGGVQTNNPHLASIASQTPAFWSYSLRNTTVFPPKVNIIDPTRYDNAGVLTLVGGGSNRATIQRLYGGPHDPNNQFAIQYDQTVYSSLSAAVDSIGAGTFIENPNLQTTALLAYIAVIHTATNLSDPTQAVIIRAGKFASP